MRQALCCRPRMDPRSPAGNGNAMIIYQEHALWMLGVALPSQDAHAEKSLGCVLCTVHICV